MGWSDFVQTFPYPLLALLVLAGFYGIYFGKMLAQRRQGIRTNQIGKRKDKTLHTVETLMKIATYAIVPVQLVSVCFSVFIAVLLTYAGSIWQLSIATVLMYQAAWSALSIAVCALKQHS